MNKTTEVWLKGLLSAGIQAASNSVITYVGADLSGVHLDPKTFALTCAVSTLVGTAAYLKQSPLPPDDSVSK